MSSPEPRKQPSLQSMFEGRVGQERLVAIIALSVAAIAIVVGIKMDVFSGNDDTGVDYWNGTPSSSAPALP